MIAVDTNLLVYAHRRDAPWHGDAVEVLRDLVEGRGGSWAIPWPCLHEFLAVVTRSLWARPMPVAAASEAVARLLASPTVELLAETDRHWEVLAGLLGTGVVGPRVHDARIAAICLEHGVGELLTADRDFSVFPTLRTRNPLVAR